MTNAIDNIATILTSDVVKMAYEDLAHPPAQEVGYIAGRICHAFRIVGLVGVLGDAADVLEGRFKNFISKYMGVVPKEKRILPDPSIICPIIQNVADSFNKEYLVKLYGELLSAATNKDKVENVHPAFINIISQLGFVDTLILNQFAKEPFVAYIAVNSVDYNYRDDMNQLPIVEPFTLIEGYEKDYDNVAASLKNLERLGLVQKTRPLFKAGSDIYTRIYQNEIFNDYKAFIKKLKDEHMTMVGGSMDLIKGSYKLTVLGEKFKKTCIIP